MEISWAVDKKKESFHFYSMDSFVEAHLVSISRVVNFRLMSGISRPNKNAGNCKTKKQIIKM